MKNLFALFLILCVLSLTSLFSFSNNKISFNGTVTFVADLQNTYPTFSQVIESGNKSYVTADVKLYKHLKESISNIYGITLKLDNIDFDQFVAEFKVDILKSETIQNQKVFYGYSKYFSNHIFIDNKMINTQIVCGEKLTVGIPAILDSF